MKSSHRQLWTSLIACLFLIGCEKPQQREIAEAEAPAPPPVAAATPPPAPADPAPAAEAQAPASAEADSTTPTEPGAEPEPELVVAMEGEKILVSGALRSKIQVERIVETLSREFPDYSVESTLAVDYDRLGVGWGNRVADEFLVPFLQRVENAKVTYRETVVTLDGKVKSPAELQMISEAAINTFSGSTTQDLKNNLKTP